MSTRNFTLELSLCSPNTKQFLDLDTTKTPNGYQLRVGKRSVFIQSRTLQGEEFIYAHMTKPEIQLLVSELTKILLFDE